MQSQRAHDFDASQDAPSPRNERYADVRPQLHVIREVPAHSSSAMNQDQPVWPEDKPAPPPQEDPALRIRRLEMELAAARDEAEALHQMLEDLPEIFERKFSQRLQSVMEQQSHLLADNQALRERFYALGAADQESAGVGRTGRPALPPATSGLPMPNRTTDPPQRRPVGEVLRRALSFGRGA